MGLRINTNQGALTALRSLRQAGRTEATALERIATALRINRASDDPSGLVISEILRSELASIDQAIENTQNDSNLVNVADAALGEVNDILRDVRTLAIANLNTGGLSAEARQANQFAADAAVQAVNRIANTSRFGSTQLLNGQSAILTNNQSAPDVQDIRVFSAQFGTNLPLDVPVSVTAAATEAATTGVIDPAQAAGSTILLRGERGTAELTFAAGATRAEVATAINSVSEQTGVVADAATGEVTSQDVGRAAFVEFRTRQGTFGGVTDGFSQGTDIQGSIAGQLATGNRNTLSVSGPALDTQVQFQAGTPAGNYNFQILGGGLRFQIGGNASPTDQVIVGIESVSASRLGQPGNNVSQIVSGQSSSLLDNPGGAIDAIDAAINQISGNRAALGATDRFVLQAQRSALEVAFENLSASESSIRDADIAEEIARGLRGRLLREAGVLTLQQNNLSQQSVLRLLGSGQ